MKSQHIDKLKRFSNLIKLGACVTLPIQKAHPPNDPIPDKDRKKQLRRSSVGELVNPAKLDSPFPPF